MNTEPAIDLRHLRFTYRTRRGPDRTVLHNLNLQVEQETLVALLGPNGSGKSTLLRVLTQLLPAEAGEVRVFGSMAPDQIRSHLGVVFQHVALDPLLSVGENLHDHARLAGLSRANAAQRIDALLTRTGLINRAGERVRTLSGGLARRVDLLRAILHQPRLLVLDEPTAGLDPVARAQFLDDLETYRADENMTVLMSTHLVDEADRADRVTMLHQGRIVADGAPVLLRSELGNRQLTVLAREWTPPEEQSEQWQRISTGWRWVAEAGCGAFAQLQSALVEQGLAVMVAPPTLADVFEAHTGSTLEIAEEMIT